MKCGEREVPHFFFYVVQGTDGIGDFGLEEFAVALAQAVDGDFDVCFGGVELFGEVGVGLGFAGAGEGLF